MPTDKHQIAAALHASTDTLRNLVTEIGAMLRDARTTLHAGEGEIGDTSGLKAIETACAAARRQLVAIDDAAWNLDDALAPIVSLLRK